MQSALLWVWDLGSSTSPTTPFVFSFTFVGWAFGANTLRPFWKDSYLKRWAGYAEAQKVIKPNVFQWSIICVVATTMRDAWGFFFVGNLADFLDFVEE